MNIAHVTCSFVSDLLRIILTLLAAVSLLTLELIKMAKMTDLQFLSEGNFVELFIHLTKDYVYF